MTAAVAEALHRYCTLKEAVVALNRARGPVYDSIKRRRREWTSTKQVAYGAELRRRHLLAGGRWRS